MTRKRGGNYAATPEIEAALGDIFNVGIGGSELGFAECDHAQFAILADAILGLGGVVSLWRDAGSGALCLSVRVGDKRRSWDFDTAEQWNAHTPALAKQFAAANAKYQRNGTGPSAGKRTAGKG